VSPAGVREADASLIGSQGFGELYYDAVRSADGQRDRLSSWTRVVVVSTRQKLDDGRGGRQGTYTV
jgi:hypothetical protein